jgi:BirA family biotin operon repressor/biotin-[acetyl-CoA-carboxylase] ligase
MKDSFKLSFDKAFGNRERLFVYEETDSTNTRAKLFAATDSAKESAIFVAKRQSSGRGRFGRSFISEEGGLYLSYLSYPEIPPSEAIMLTVFAAVCVCETVEELTGASPVIKWVNDVYLNGRKLSGILTEGAFSPDGKSFEYAVTGIGVNLLKTEFPPELQSIATDLETETGMTVDAGAFAKLLSDKLAEFSVNDKSYMQKYRERCFHLGSEVTVITAGGSYTALAKRILDDGSLAVEAPDGKEHILFTGEVSLKVKK